MKRVERFEVGRRYRCNCPSLGEFVAKDVSPDGKRCKTTSGEELKLDLCIYRHLDDLPILRVQSASGSLPRYATAGAAGLDLESAIDVDVAANSRAIIPTGLSLEIPAGYEGQVRPRSGLTARTNLTVHLGTIDSDYRGEVGVIVENCGPAPCSITKGQRIAQLVIAPVARVEVVLVDSLGGTDRGDGGFGSTGQ